MQNISNQPIGNFFKELDLNGYVLFASCIVFATWFNQRYPDTSVLDSQNIDENYYNIVTKGFLAGAYSLVRNWQAEYSQVDATAGIQGSVGQRKTA